MTLVLSYNVCKGKWFIFELLVLSLFANLILIAEVMLLNCCWCVLYGCI